MKRKFIVIPLFTIAVLLYSCKSDKTVQDQAEVKTQTDSSGNTSVPVTVTSPVIGSIGDTVELNATSAFLLRTYVKSSANGYLQLVDAQPGHYITKGQDMFIVKTKEAQSLGNTILSLDSSFHFNGIIHIKSPATGYVSQLNSRTGDYVQDGEQLATITDTKSLVFILALPYELKPYLAGNRQLSLKLPDGTILEGRVVQAMPTVDSVSQTQNHMIRVKANIPIPENLVAKVRLVKNVKIGAVILPKSAVLGNETQTEFWIMKMTDSVTAIKVMVQKGLESGDKVEIVSPRLQPGDKILLTGNYGLTDTAKVTVIK
jgi:multidrug efflux pump subunit AcrA (membrane-fusion protein)